VGAVGMVVGQIVAVDTADPSRPGHIRQHEHRGFVGGFFRRQLGGHFHILVVAGFEFFEIGATLADKVQWVLEGEDFAVQLLRGEMQVFEIAAVAVVVDINTQVFQPRQFLFAVAAILGKAEGALAQVVSKGANNGPASVSTFEVVIHQQTGTDIRCFVDDGGKCCRAGLVITGKMVINVKHAGASGEHSVEIGAVLVHRHIKDGDAIACIHLFDLLEQVNIALHAGNQHRITGFGQTQLHQ